MRLVGALWTTLMTWTLATEFGGYTGIGLTSQAKLLVGVLIVGLTGMRGAKWPNMTEGAPLLTLMTTTCATEGADSCVTTEINYVEVLEGTVAIARPTEPTFVVLTMRAVGPPPGVPTPLDHCAMCVGME